MAYVNPRSGFTTKPDIAGQLNNLTAILQQMSAKQQQEKQFKAQMAQRKAEEKVRQKQWQDEMEIKRDQLEEAKLTNVLTRDLYQLQIDIGTTEQEMLDAKAEYDAALGAWSSTQQPLGTSQLPQGTSRAPIDRQTPGMGADAAMLNDLTGLAAQGVQPPSTVSRATPQPGMVPTGGRPTEESYRAWVAQQPEHIRVAAVRANPGFFMPRDLSETMAWLDASRLWGFELPSDLKPMEGMVTEKRALDDRLLNMQITQEEYKTESLRLDNEWQQFRMDNKEKFLPQYGGGGGGGGAGGGLGLPTDTGETFDWRSYKTGLIDTYSLQDDVLQRSSTADLQTKTQGLLQERTQAVNANAPADVIKFLDNYLALIKRHIALNEPDKALELGPVAETILKSI